MQNFLAGARDPTILNSLRRTHVHSYLRIYGKTWRVSSTLENTFVQAHCSFRATAFARAVATLRYVKKAHSARERLLRPIGIDKRGRERERERASKCRRGIKYREWERQRSETTTVAIRGLKLAGKGGERAVPPGACSAPARYSAPSPRRDLSPHWPPLHYQDSNAVTPYS